jgi:hypothetical protein
MAGGLPTFTTTLAAVSIFRVKPSSKYLVLSRGKGDLYIGCPIVIHLKTSINFRQSTGERFQKNANLAWKHGVLFSAAGSSAQMVMIQQKAKYVLFLCSLLSDKFSVTYII